MIPLFLVISVPSTTDNTYSWMFRIGAFILVIVLGKMKFPVAPVSSIIVIFFPRRVARILNFPEPSVAATTYGLGPSGPSPSIMISLLYKFNHTRLVGV
jgi:hypothetical protein